MMLIHSPPGICSDFYVLQMRADSFRSSMLFFRPVSFGRSLSSERPYRYSSQAHRLTRLPKRWGGGGWRTAWRNLREAAAKGDMETGRADMLRLADLRFHDLRHQFVTELCEAGVPEAVIPELASHVDLAMMRIYSHPRLAAKRLAVEALAAAKGDQSEEGYVTKTLSSASGVIENRWSGRPDLNWGPLGPEPSALPGYATPRQEQC